MVYMDMYEKMNRAQKRPKMMRLTLKLAPLCKRALSAHSRISAHVAHELFLRDTTFRNEVARKVID